MPTPLARPFVPFIERLALESGDFIRPLFEKPNLTVELKADRTVVTEADRGAEALLRDRIRATFPDHGILGEEFGPDRPDAEFVWILDPIDGTISFVHGCPLFGTLIGLLHQGRPILGAIHQPIVRQLCIGDGEETRLNGRIVRASATTDLSQATLLCTDLHSFDRTGDTAAFEALRSRCALLRTWGDCYGYLLVATGRADIMLDPRMSPWDLLPLLPVLEGAGARISDWTGQVPHLGNSAIATAPALHDQVCELLRRPASGDERRAAGACDTIC